MIVWGLGASAPRLARSICCLMFDFVIPAQEDRLFRILV